MNAEQIERSWLLAQTGELSDTEQDQLHQALDTSPACAEVSLVNRRLLDAARAALTQAYPVPPISAVCRETILESAAALGGDGRVQVRAHPTVSMPTWGGLPRHQILALVATLVVVIGMGAALLSVFLRPSPAHTAGTTVSVENVIASDQVDQLTQRLALDRAEYAFSATSVDEMLYDLALLEETQI